MKAFIRRFPNTDAFESKVWAAGFSVDHQRAQPTHTADRIPMAKSDDEGLSLWYRITYRVKYLGLHLFGPAQLGQHDDPHIRLKRQRDRKVAAARQARLARGGDQPH
jgi:hypothetical protein